MDAEEGRGEEQAEEEGMGHGLRCIGMRARPGASAEERECRQSGADLERHSQRSLLASHCQSLSTRAQRMILVTDIDTSRSRERVSLPPSPLSSHAAAPLRSFLPPLLHRCLRRR